MSNLYNTTNLKTAADQQIANVELVLVIGLITLGALLVLSAILSKTEVTGSQT